MLRFVAVFVALVLTACNPMAGVCHGRAGCCLEAQGTSFYACVLR